MCNKFEIYLMFLLKPTKRTWRIFQ